MSNVRSFLVLGVTTWAFIVCRAGMALALTQPRGGRSKPVTDCEWAAAARSDDGHSSVAALAERITGICGVEILKAERAFHLSPNDPNVKMDELK